ncbi:unnamed protein product [Moneuplotes crassus]|uniref:Uncharacterized protein n=1 Tax=Euplotes crassus TaxID=5936 RepID=A0AAD1XJI1_EUPCR|nr:unnamed protein product [Moneuplotes crassus]
MLALGSLILIKICIYLKFSRHLQDYFKAKREDFHIFATRGGILNVLKGWLLCIQYLPHKKQLKFHKPLSSSVPNPLTPLNI